MRRLLPLLLVLIALVPALGQAPPSGPDAAAPVLAAGAFRVTFIAARQPAPYSGRVYLILGKSSAREPRLQMGNWMNGPQLFAKEVKEVPVSGSVVMDAECLGFPASFA